MARNKSLLNLCQRENVRKEIVLTSNQKINKEVVKKEEKMTKKIYSEGKHYNHEREDVKTEEFRPMQCWLSN